MKPSSRESRLSGGCNGISRWRFRKPRGQVPLKQGILQDAQQHLELLGITAEQLKQAIATWCQGSRYWSCMVEDAPRLDLQGQVAGKVTAEQAVYARRQASRRQREQMREARQACPGR